MLRHAPCDNYDKIVGNLTILLLEKVSEKIDLVSKGLVLVTCLYDTIC